MTSYNCRHFPNMYYTAKEKAFCVRLYFTSNSYSFVRSMFRNEFQTRVLPSKQIICYWVSKFNSFSALSNRFTNAGRPRSSRTADNIASVDESVKLDPEKSTRRRSQELNIERSSLLNILHKDLNVHPYRLQIKQELSPEDIIKRVDMCQWFQEQFDVDESFIHNVWFSDEAHFLLSGHVNSKNNIHWGSSPPDKVLTRPLHSAKVTVWAAISRHGIIGPFFFEDEDGSTTTVSTETYLTVLRKFWRALGDRRLDRGTQWFQQDGATPHTSNASLDWLRKKFGDRLISRRCAIEWAPHSPDLNPPDFFLWGHLKGKVYENSPQTLQELKTSIVRQTRRITREQIRNVIDHFVRRVKICLQRGGAHLEHVL